MNFKKLILTAVMLLTVTGNGFSKTKIEGLDADKAKYYHIEIIISSNDAKKEIISVGLINHLTISETNQVGSELKRTTLLNQKITKDEYETIFKKAVETIENFKFPQKSHLTKDATHYELRLTINRRTISVQYESVDSLEKTSKSLDDIIKMTRKYLKENHTAQQNSDNVAKKTNRKISAEVTEKNYNKTKMVVVSKNPQEVYCHRASLVDGGIYAKVTIQTEDKYVKVCQFEAMSINEKSRENSHTYLLPLHSLTTETLNLKMANGPIKITIKAQP